MAIIRGTTPTIEIAFSTITPSELDAAVLVIECAGNKQELGLDRADLGAHSLIYTLTQSETLAFPEGQTALITCVWLTNGGVRGQSRTAAVYITNTPKNEVMP